MGLSRKQWLWILGVATVLYDAVFLIPSQQMTDAGGPGIAGFEMVGTAERAARYMEQWGEAGISAAKWGLWIDFPFIIIFVSFFALATRAVADRCRDRGRPGLESLGKKIWVLPIIAGACDVLEDIGLLAIVYGDTGSVAPALATTFAVSKFVLLAITVSYLIVALVGTATAQPRLAAKLPDSSGD